MRRVAVPFALTLGACLHGPVGPTWYGRGPNTSPPSDPLRAPGELARALPASEQSCRTVLEEASALGYEPANAGRPCQRTRVEATPFYLALGRPAEGGLRRELTFAWKEGAIEGAAYVPAYPAQRDAARKELAATAAEWSDVLGRAALRQSAAPDKSAAEAAAHFDRAVGLYRQGQLEAALLEFEAAYETSPRWEVHYNIAVTLQRLGRSALAREVYGLYLEEGGAQVPTERRADVAKAMASLEARLGRVNLQVVGQALEVRVDRRSYGENPPPVLWLEPGRHEFSALYGDQRRAGIAVSLGAGEIASVLLEVPAR